MIAYRKLWKKNEFVGGESFFFSVIFPRCADRRAELDRSFMREHQSYKCTQNSGMFHASISVVLVESMSVNSVEVSELPALDVL